MWNDAPAQPSAEESRYQASKLKLHRQIVEQLDLSKIGRRSPDEVREELRTMAQKVVRDDPRIDNDVDREAIIEDILSEAFGTGPLEDFMNDPSVADILVNGPDEVYIERDGRLFQTDVKFADDAHVMQVIQRIASQVGRRIDQSSAIVDARLPDGSRVNAIVPPLSLNGPTLSIRRFGVRHRVEDLLDNGTLPPDVLTLIQAAVEARLGVLITGGTGSGKTTLLNCISRFIPDEERLVTIEDTAELALQRPHVVRLETRPPGIDGTGAMTPRELVRNSLRMRPDRIIVGEVRGAEALDMLQAMNTGHEGSLTTIHANGVQDALARLAMMVTMAKLDLPVDVIRTHIGFAISLVIHLERLRGGRRRVMRVSEAIRHKRRGYVVRDIFAFEKTGVRDDHAIGEFRATGWKPKFLPHLAHAGCDVPEDLFRERVIEVRDSDDAVDWSAPITGTGPQPGDDA